LQLEGGRAVTALISGRLMFIRRHVLEAWQVARSLTGSIPVQTELVSASIEYHEQVRPHTFVNADVLLYPADALVDP
jgi:hypothetical protein